MKFNRFLTLKKPSSDVFGRAYVSHMISTHLVYTNMKGYELAKEVGCSPAEISEAKNPEAKKRIPKAILKYFGLEVVRQPPKYSRIRKGEDDALL